MTNTAEKLTLPLFMVKYNGDLLISTGRSRFETCLLYTSPSPRDS